MMRTIPNLYNALLLNGLPLLLIFLVVPLPTLAQNNPPEPWAIETIGRTQAAYLQQHYTERLGNVVSTTELDTLIREAQASWAAEAGAKYDGIDKLTSPAYLFFLVRPGKAQIDQTRLRHVATHYQLPAFIEEYEYLKEDPNYGKAVLLREARNAFLRAHQMELPEPLWRELHSVYVEIPEVIRKYLDVVDFESEAVKTQLTALLWELPQQQALWAISERLYAGDLAGARDKVLADLAVNANNAGWTIHLGRRLVERFSTNGDDEAALDLLDVLIAEMPVEMLERLSTALSADYARFGAEDGEQLASQQLALRRSSEQGGTTQRVLLSGRYVDLTSGDLIDLSRFQGKTVFLDFWASWCSPCRAEIPELIEFAEAQRDRDDFAFISINGDQITGGATETELRAFVQETGINYISLLDDPEHSLTQQFGVSAWPSKTILDGQGNIIVAASERMELEQIIEYLSQE